METVGSQLTFSNGVVAHNRTLKSAMTERLCTWSADLKGRGHPTEAYINMYKLWGEGQVGVMIFGNVPCDVRYPEAARNMCLDPDESPPNIVQMFKPAITAAKAHGSLAIIQITHAGRQTPDTVTKNPVSASESQSTPIGGPYGVQFGKARALAVEEIRDVVRRFAWAAKKSQEAGADGIQLHVAHGYLLSQFCSPRTNKRTDQYGGSLENRTRIVFEIFDAIREQIKDPKFLLSVKINSQDFLDGGFDAEDSRETCRMLEQAGVHLIELSGGTYEKRVFFHQKESTIRREAFFIEFADRIRPHLTSAKLCVTGGFRSTRAMGEAIESGACDLVGLGRPLTWETDLPKRLVSGQSEAALENKTAVPTQSASSFYAIGQIAYGKGAPNFTGEAFAKRVDEAISKDIGQAYRCRPVVDGDEPLPTYYIGV